MSSLTHSLLSSGHFNGDLILLNSYSMIRFLHHSLWVLSLRYLVHYVCTFLAFIVFSPRAITIIGDNHFSVLEDINMWWVSVCPRWQIITVSRALSTLWPGIGDSYTGGNTINQDNTQWYKCHVTHITSNNREGHNIHVTLSSIHEAFIIHV